MTDTPATTDLQSRTQEAGLKRVVMACEVYEPLETATAHIMTAIAEGVGGQFPVRVITVDPGSSSDELPTPREESRGGVQVQRLRIKKLDKNRLLSRVVSAITSTAVISAAVFKCLRRGDALFVTTNPPLLVPVLAVIGRVRRARFVILVHDVYPDAMVAAGLSGPVKLFLPLLRWISVYGFRTAYRVVVIGRDMRELIQNRYGLTDGQLEYIPNWADTDSVKPQDPNDSKLRSELGLTDKFVVVFAGNIGRVQDIENIIEAAKLLPPDGDIHLLFVGDGAKAYLLREPAVANALSNVTYIGQRPREQQQDFLGAGDVGLITLADGMFGVGVPSKFYNLLAAGKPIIAAVAEGSEVGRSILEEELGWVVPPGNPGALAQAIREAAANKSQLQPIGTRARQLAEFRFSPAEALAQYRSVFAAAFSAEES